MSKHNSLAVAVCLVIGVGVPGPVSLAQTPEAEEDIWELIEDSTPAEPAAPAPDNRASDNSSGGSPTAGQETAPSTEAETRARPKSPAIEEIIVTAQRREENIQDVAISITVFDQEQIANANMTNSADLANYTPSLQANTRFGPENASFTIRGFTQDLRTTASVGTYLAEVVAPRGQSSQTSGDGAGPGAMFDLQNIQVLKGPQGTLFGRNTTGGAILLVPNRPTDEFEGFAEYSGGNLDERRAQFIINAPLNDDFKIRFGIDNKERDGHLNNVFRRGANELGNVDYTAGRLSMVWDVTDELENYTILQAVNSDTFGYTSQLYDCLNPIDSLLGVVQDPTSIDIEALLAGLPGILTGDINPTNLIPGVPLPSPFSLLIFQPCEQQLANQAAAGENGFYDVVSTVADPQTQIKERRFINTTTWEMTDSVTLKNILAYAHLHTENESNVFGTYFPDTTDSTGRREFSPGASVASSDVPVTSQETWVEEIQLQGTAFNDRLIWQGGLYYENSRPDGFSGNTAASFIYCDLGSIAGKPENFDCFDPLLGILGGVLKQNFQTEYLNKAVYAQGTYDIFEPFSVTLGLRYTWDETEGYGIKNLYKYALGVQQAPAITVANPKVESTAPTGMLEFNYRPWDGLMTYVKYTRGYRQGSVNLAADIGLDTHDPETVDTYEAGFKSSFDWPIPGRFNVSVFDNTLTDMQLQGGYISTTSGPTTAIFNAGEGSSRGYEIEAFFQPFQFLTASLSYSYLDTELVESADFCSGVQDIGFLEGSSCTPIADVGDELPYAPDKSYVANVNVFLPIPQEFGIASFGTTYAYTGKQRVAATSSTPHAILDDFGLLNFNLSWNNIFGEPLDFVLFATNVTEEEYVTYTSGTYTLLGLESRAVGLPRTIGGRLRYNF